MSTFRIVKSHRLKRHQLTPDYTTFGYVIQHFQEFVTITQPTYASPTLSNGSRGMWTDYHLENYATFNEAKNKLDQILSVKELEELKEEVVFETNR